VLGDRKYASIVAAATEELGRAIGVLVNALDPEAVVVGGGLGLVDHYRESVAGAMYRAVAIPTAARPPVIGATLGTDAGIVGAALAARPRS
jgi:glucokinase